MTSSRQTLFWGVDFGSAFTRIAYGAGEGGHIARLSALDYYGVPSHPSGVAHDPAHDHWLSGRAWESALASPLPLQVWSDPRRELELAAGRPNFQSHFQVEPVFEAIQRFFLRLTAQIQENTGGTGKGAIGSGGATLCVPSEAAPIFKTALQKAVSLPQIEFISVAEAAILGFEITSRLDERPRLLAVFEAGAGACRCTLLEVRKRQGFLNTRLLASAHDERCGARALDETLFERLQLKNPALQIALGALDTQNRAAAACEALWQIQTLRARLENTREAALEATLHRLPGQTLKLERLMAENALEDLTLRAANVLDEALSRAGLDAEQIAILLPVGGLTRVAGMARMLGNRVPYVETSPSILATHTDLLAPARGAARHSAALASQNASVRLVPLQRPPFGVRIGDEIDPILPLNAPPQLRRSKVYASEKAVASGVRFQIWSGFGRSIETATPVGEVVLPVAGENWHLDEQPVRVSLELRAPTLLQVEIEPLGTSQNAPMLEKFEQIQPNLWQKAN